MADKGMALILGALGKPKAKGSEDDDSKEDSYLDEACDAAQDGDKEGFRTAMKAAFKACYARMEKDESDASDDEEA